MPTEVPPQLPLYQCRVVPDPPLAVSVTLATEPLQKMFWLTLADVGAVGAAQTTMEFVSVKAALTGVPQALVAQAFSVRL